MQDDRLERIVHLGFASHFAASSRSVVPGPNQARRCLAANTERPLPYGMYRSTEELEQAIDEYLSLHNEVPKPFIWTKSAE